MNLPSTCLTCFIETGRGVEDSQFDILTFFFLGFVQKSLRPGFYLHPPNDILFVWWRYEAPKKCNIHCHLKWPNVDFIYLRVDRFQKSCFLCLLQWKYYLVVGQLNLFLYKKLSVFVRVCVCVARASPWCWFNLSCFILKIIWFERILFQAVERQTHKLTTKTI